MLLLEATDQRQGERTGDYHRCRNGELAYHPALDCSAPNCGCERGWAGFDSHQATTTVQVVDRPDVTVQHLAKLLATSLWEGGWVEHPDPTDVHVTEFLDDIIEIANHFGEGAILERDGGWIRKRDGLDVPTNPLDRATIESLVDRVADMGPIGVLTEAAIMLHGEESFVPIVLDTLEGAQWGDAQKLGCAIDWLFSPAADHRHWCDVPGWLEHLDECTVRSARRRLGDTWAEHLVEIDYHGDILGTVVVATDERGSITTVMLVNSSLASHCQIITTVERGAQPPFRRIATKTARKAIDSAQRQAPPLSLGETPASAPPDSRVIGFILEHMTWT